MSLISDALRKARQESAAREARARGLDQPVVAGYWRRRRTLSLGWAAVLVAGAAVVGGGLAWWGLGHGGNSGPAGDGATPPSVEQVSAVVAEAATAPEGETVIEVPTTDEAREPVPAASTERPPLPTAVPDDAGQAPPVQPPAEQRAAKEPPPEPTPAAVPADGEYVAEADLGATTLVLDYLVFRRDDPFAQINGIDVHVGSIIEGYTVHEITANSVVLIRDDARVVLKVR